MKTDQMIAQNTVTRPAGVSQDYANPGTFAGYWKLVLETNKLIICPRSRKMLGIAKRQPAGLDEIFALMDQDGVTQLIREFKFSCTFNTKFEVQVRVNMPKGKAKWFRISGVKHYGRWGKSEQMVGVIEDTTQRVNEDCLSLAVVNHELRNPLTIIKLNVQLLINLMSAKPDKYPVKVLNNVDLQINCMTNLIDEYLTSPVSEQRRSEMNKTIFDLDELIDIMINEMKILHPGYRFVKKCSVPVLVKADKYKIVQVFINYLTNAVNFSAQCSQIMISTTHRSDGVEVAIRDPGIGIPEGQEEQIFQKFFQGSDTSIRKKNSRGLGLYLVKKIISEHDGTVRAERATEGGSVFYFSLPVHQCHA